MGDLSSGTCEVGLAIPEAASKASIRKIMPCFSACEIASVIGLHHCNLDLHALIRIWRRYDRASLRNWEGITGGVPLPEAIFAKHAKSSVRAAVTAAVQAGEDRLPEEAEAAIAEAVKATAPAELWNVLSEEALGQAKRGRGTLQEKTGLDAYEQQSGRHVIDRNRDQLFRLFGSGVTSFAVVGRVDGFEEVSGQHVIVEHKRRQRRLFRDIPCYEQIQCLAYMAMTTIPRCRWVQTMGPRIDSQMFLWCPDRWHCVEVRLSRVARLLRGLRSGALLLQIPELRDMLQDLWNLTPSWPRSPTPILFDESERALGGASDSEPEMSCTKQMPVVQEKFGCVLERKRTASDAALDLDRNNERDTQSPFSTGDAVSPLKRRRHEYKTAHAVGK